MIHDSYSLRTQFTFLLLGSLRTENKYLRNDKLIKNASTFRLTQFIIA